MPRLAPGPALLLLLLSPAALALSCGGADPKPAASLDQLAACATTLEEIRAAPVESRASALARSLPEGRLCWRTVFAGCVAPERSQALEAEGQTQFMLDVQRGCLDNFCDQLTPTPTLCADASAADALEGDPLRDLYSEFIAAKLAREFSTPRDEPRIARVADAYADFWTTAATLGRIRVAPPKPAPAPPSLSLRVAVDEDSFVLSGEGVAPIRVAPRDGDSLDRHDYEALAREARALKQRFPAASLARVEVSDAAPMQVVIRTIETLKGDGCDTSAPDDRCLFTQVAIAPPDAAP